MTATGQIVCYITRTDRVLPTVVVMEDEILASRAFDVYAAIVPDKR